MGIIASAQGEQKNFEKPTEMIQKAVLADVVDKGLVPNKFKAGSTQHKAYFVWILAEEDSEGRNKRVFQSFTVSLHEKATLRKLLKDFGVKVTKSKDGKELFDGAESVDLEKYIGLQRTLVMSTEDGDNGEPYIKILATQKSSGEGVEIPADFVRKQDKPAKQ